MKHSRPARPSADHLAANWSAGRLRPILQSMTTTLYRPGPPLDRFIECFWHVDGDPLRHERERLLPTGRLSIIFRLSDERIRVFRDVADREGTWFDGAVVSGPYAHHYVLDTSQPRASVGIYFRAGAPATLLGAPAGEFANAHVTLDAVWGRAARRVHERLSAAGSAEAAFALLEAALGTRLGDNSGRHPAVSQALRHISARPALARVEAVRSETGYGAKRFIELFREAVGLTPKAYCRVQRFQHVLKRAAKGGVIDWAAVALDGGYCDQPHLNREFRAFAGVTPAQYRPVSSGDPNHVPVER